MLRECSVIFLDFDGVLFSTIKEAYAICMIVQKKARTIEDINFNSQHYKFFAQYRYLIGPAWNYYYLLKLIDTKAISFDYNYLQELYNASKEEYQEFEYKYFLTRSLLQEEHFKSWLSLNETTPFLSMVKPLIKSYKSRFYIVTTKDKKTVQALLKLHNIFVDDAKIFDKESYEKYTSKANIIKNIMQNEKIENSIFVDDHQKYLKECYDIKNLTLLQANWGYISANDKEALPMHVILEKIERNLDV